jgi:hypothetical protein
MTFMQNQKTIWNPGFLLLCSLLLCLLWYCLGLFFTDKIYPDSLSYAAAADGLWQHARGHDTRPIGMAFIHGIPFLWGNQLYANAWLINGLSWLVCQLFLFRLMRRRLPNHWAFWLTLATNLFVGLVSSMPHLLSELPFMALMMAAWDQFDWYDQKKDQRYLSASLALILFSMLVRPGMQFFGFLFLICHLPLLWKNRAKRIFWPVYGVLLLIAVQFAGMKHQFGNARLSYVDVITYYNYVGSKAACLAEGHTYQQLKNPRADYFYTLSYTDRVVVAKADFYAQLKQHPQLLLKAFFLNVYENSTTGSIVASDSALGKEHAWVNTFAQIQNVVFSSMGFVLALFFTVKGMIRKQWNPTFWMALWVLYTLLSSGISSDQGDRMHLVCYLVIGVLGVSNGMKHASSVKKYA